MAWTCPDCPMGKGLGYPKRTNTAHSVALHYITYCSAHRNYVASPDDDAFPLLPSFSFGHFRINKCDQGKERKESLTDGLDKGTEFFRVTAGGGTRGGGGEADQIDKKNNPFFVLRIDKGIMDFGIVKSQWA
eukprot:scaffold208721_cov31-Attheya_sp.AAC.1